MHHLYLSYQPSQEHLSKERSALEQWCASRGVEDSAILEEKLTTGRISENMIRKALRPVQKGDTVVATSLSRLGRGINMLLTVVTLILERGASIYIIDEDCKYTNGPESEQLLSQLEFAVNVIKKIKTERGNEALYEDHSRGIYHGRPPGSKKAAEKNVLYGKEERLKQLYADHVPVTDIMAELGVSRGTIMNYLKANSITRCRKTKE